jgi:hypothetical protein
MRDSDSAIIMRWGDRGVYESGEGRKDFESRGQTCGEITLVNAHDFAFHLHHDRIGAPQF